jgi:alpha-L-rhamnosidase
MFWVYLTVIFSAVIITAARLPAPFDVRIDHYKVDTTKDLVIDAARPRLSWKLPVFNQRNVQQTAYQIQIKSDTEQWDSERIVSSQSIHVPYFHEKDLQSSTHYQVRLRVWTTVSDQASSWTYWIQFRTSMFNLHEFLIQNNDQVNWIGSTQIYMNELRKEFNVPNTSPIRTATVFICGLGYYELYLNGQSVDDSRKLDPGWTTYEKRTLFVSYDLTKTLKVRIKIFLMILRLVYLGWYECGWC